MAELAPILMADIMIWGRAKMDIPIQAWRINEAAPGRGAAC